MISINNILIKRLRNRKNSPYDTTNLSAVRCGPKGIIALEPRANAALPLPPVFLTGPGFYEVDGNSFDLSQPGCYRFTAPGRISQQILVASDSCEETVALTQWFHGYGNADDSLTSDALLKAVSKRRVWVTCSKAALLVSHLLNSTGFTARPVAVLTLKKWDKYDNGHTLIEVLLPSGWAVFDPAFGAWPLVDKKFVSVRSLCTAIHSGKKPQIQLVEAGATFGKFSFNKEDLGLWLESRWRHPKAIADWYQSVAQVALIGDGKRYYFSEHDENVEQQVSSYSKLYHYLDKKHFTNRFYPKEDRDLHTIT